MRISIIGIGLIGGSMAIALREEGIAKHIIGVDTNVENAQRSLQLQLVDEINELDVAIQKSDLIILAIPVDAILKMLPIVLDNINSNAIVIDMGSTKQSICKIADMHKNRKQFIALHPMAGTENSGPEAAISKLFENKLAIICDEENSDIEKVRIIKNILNDIGMKVKHMNSKEHDTHAAYVSHITHITSFILAETVLDVEKSELAILDMASGGFESTVRLAKSSPEMWAPIFLNNKESILIAINQYMSNLNAFKNHLINNETTDLLQTMKKANEIKKIWHK